jgi:hypothetical protein
MKRLEALLAADAILYFDGGGEAAAARKPIYGAAEIGRFFAGARRKGYFGPSSATRPRASTGNPV